MKDKDLIESGEGCLAEFARTVSSASGKLVVCASCLNAACEGEHGNFAYKSFTCVICSIQNDYKTRQQATPANV
jgi:hypothetical protein